MTWDQAVDRFCRWLCLRFPHRARIIPHAEDPHRPLLIQFMLWPHHLYLQHFITPEHPKWFHRHRWAKMRSWVLSGFFVEARPGENYQRHERGTTYTMDRSVIHHVVWWGPECWTLFWVRGATDDWGYYPARAFAGNVFYPGHFVPWREHVQKRVANIETGELTK